MNFKNILLMAAFVPSVSWSMKADGYLADFAKNGATSLNLPGAATNLGLPQVATNLGLVDASKGIGIESTTFVFNKLDSYGANAQNAGLIGGIALIGLAGVSTAKDHFFPTEEQRLMNADLKERLAVLEGKNGLRECLQKNSKKIIDSNCDFSHCSDFMKNYTMAAGKAATDGMLEDFRSAYNQGK